MKNKAVFFDRDGTINNNSDYYVFSPERFVFNPGVIETLQKLTEKGYLLFIVSNQSGIAKGIYGHDDVKNVHDFMNRQLAEKGIVFTGIIYCSHHPEHGKCLCRKPQSLLIERLAARHSVDLSASYMVGDAQRDIDAGTAAGLSGILIEANSDISSILEKIV